MATTSLGFPYPAATDAPDGPGAFYNLANFIDGFLAQQGWAPVLGGTGAAIGSGGTTGGYVSRNGKQITFNGWVKFGSSGSLGSSTVMAGLNTYGTLNTDLTFGDGWYVGGSNPRRLLLTPLSASEFRVWHAGTDPVSPASNIGTPGNGDKIIFRVEGVLA